MKKIIHKADTRGQANFWWLNSKHAFSFGQYFNPDRIRFGALRVLNDDVVIGGAGFPTHPHENMEIISIPLKGALAHKDSTGTERVIKTGEVQIMSAGSGLTHSEYNASSTDEVNFLQIWILPKERNISPRYDQKKFSIAERKNKFHTVVSPKDEHVLWINQDAYLSLAYLDSNKTIEYSIVHEGNGVYVFVMDGQVEIAGNTLTRRDAMGISELEHVSIAATKDAKLLLIEVPMH